MKKGSAHKKQTAYKHRARRTLLLVLLSALLQGFIPSGCGRESAPESVSLEIYAMDTHMLLTAYIPSRNTAASEEEINDALTAAADEIARLDALLSTGDPDSEVSRINHAFSSSAASGQASDQSAGKEREAAAPTPVLSEDTRTLLEQSLSLYKETGGAFDITIYPLMELWGFSSKEFRVPQDAEIKAALSRTGSDGICFDASTGTIAFSKKDMEIDFGGIAKGYASDRAAGLLRLKGIESALINLGGNVKTVGTKPDGTLFRIAIQDPEESDQYLGILSSRDEAVITSGGYERYFEQDGIRYHHILDPHNGRPARSGLKSVTVVTESGTRGDGLSTALYVMGPDEAVSFWNARRDFEMILLTDDGRLLITPGAAERFETDREVTLLVKRG